MKRKLQLDRRNGHYFVWIARSGVRRYFRFGTNKKAAAKELDCVERRIASGEIRFAEKNANTVVRGDGTKDMPLKDLAEAHLSWVKGHRSNGTFLVRQYFVSLFVNYIGPRMVSSLKPKDIEDFFDKYRTSRGKNGKSRDRGYHAVREVRSMLRWGAQEEVCANPITRYPPAPKCPPPTRYFTDRHLSQLLNKAPPDFADLLVFGTLTGLRPQEIRALTRQNITSDQNGRSHLRIEHHKTSESAKVPIPRTVPLSKEADEIARRQLANHPNVDVVFLNDDGTPYSADALRRRLARWCKRAGVPKMPPYALRHVFGTLQASNGTNQTILAQLMGHSNLQTTARYVVHCDEAHVGAVDAVARHVHHILDTAKETRLSNEEE